MNTLHLFTCINEPTNMKVHITHPKFTHLLSSTSQSQSQSLTPICLNDTKWTSHATTFANLAKAIAGLPDNAIVCYVNKECIMNISSDELVQRFLDENLDIVFGAQIECPHAQRIYYVVPSGLSRFIEKYNQHGLPASSRHQYLSAGTMIGYKHAIMHLLQYRTEIDTLRICGEGGDEAYLTEYFLNNVKYNTKIRMGLDTKCRIFWNMHRVNWHDIWIKNGHIYNRILNETPAFVHFNRDSWRTEDGRNIMYTCLQKMEHQRELIQNANNANSENTANATNSVVHNINSYKQHNKNYENQWLPFVHTPETKRLLQNLGGIYYINLDRRADRRTEIERELHRFGMTNAQRFQAIDRPEPGKGIVGCTNSHLNLFKLARDRFYRNVLIFEDDFVFTVTPSDFYHQLKLLFEPGPPPTPNETRPIEFDVCMLAYNNKSPAQETRYPFLLKCINAQTASAYIVNENMYNRLIDLYDWALPLLDSTNKHWLYANDQVWKNLQEPSNWYCLKQRQGKQSDGYSDNSQNYVEYDEY